MHMYLLSPALKQIQTFSMIIFLQASESNFRMTLNI